MPHFLKFILLNTESGEKEFPHLDFVFYCTSRLDVRTKTWPEKTQATTSCYSPQIVAEGEEAVEGRDLAKATRPESLFIDPPGYF